MRFLRTAFYVFLVFGAVSISCHALGYFDGEVKNLLESKDAQLLGNWIYRMGFYSHAAFGIVALLSGPWQFLAGLRRRHLKLHRVLGYIYAGSVALSGLAGLAIATKATGGIVTATGFAILAILWLFTTALALRAAWRKQITTHQIWMRRSYALAFTAVTLRLWLLSFPVFDLDFISAYRIAAWMPWLLNLLVVESFVYIRRRPVQYATT